MKTETSAIRPSLTPNEAAHTIGISRAHLFRIIKQGKIQVYRPGTRILRIRPEAVEVYMASCTSQ